MSQHLHHHHPTYVHYTGPPDAHIQAQVIHAPTGIAPQDTTHQHHQPHAHHHHQQQHQVPHPSSSSSPIPGGGGPPLVATGDWTKDLVHLAKTAELKKHALTLQLHTAHILSAHASLAEKSKAIQDIREQKNKLESERQRLLSCLREVNEDRDKADLMESSIEKECNELRARMNQLTDGDYTIAKNDVDRLRQELGQPPLPSLQETLEEKTAQYLNERRLNGSESQSGGGGGGGGGGTKRAAQETQLEAQQGTGKRPRGRPKGSKNRVKSGSAVASGSASAGASAGGANGAGAAAGVMM